MSLFRKLFNHGLIEISDRVYVFDCCFTSTDDAWEKQNYKGYVGCMMTQLREHYPNASILFFNFREGESPSLIANALSEHDVIIMEYPRQYGGCPMLPMEAIRHFLRSSESWLSLGLQNLLLVHCERGSWPVLAFMLAALLIYRKQYVGEHKTLDMVYKQAPCELLHSLSPLNPMPSQLRYLQYVSRRNVDIEWSPLDRDLNMECVVIRMTPNFDGEGGCRPVFRIYGQDSLCISDRTAKVLLSTPKDSKTVRHYKQADSEIIKIDINCRIQGDAVLECISLHDDMEREEMMFRVMFNTAFVRSNILTLNRDEIDILWDAKDWFPKDFRVEVIFSEMDVVASKVPVDFVEEMDSLPVEAFAKVQEKFSRVDLLVPKDDAALEVLRHITVSETVMKSYSQAGKPQDIQSAAVEYSTKRAKDLSSENQSNFSSKSSPNADVGKKQIEPHSLGPIIPLNPKSIPSREHSPPLSTSEHHQLSSSPSKQFDLAAQENVVPKEVSPPLESAKTFSSTSQNKTTKVGDVDPGRPLFDVGTSLPLLTPHLEDNIEVQNEVPLPLVPPDMSTPTPTLKDAGISIPSAQSPASCVSVIRSGHPKPLTASSTEVAFSEVNVGTRIEFPPLIALSSNQNDNQALEGGSCPPPHLHPSSSSSSLMKDATYGVEHPALPPRPVPPNESTSITKASPHHPPPPLHSGQGAVSVNPPPMSRPPPPPAPFSLKNSKDTSLCGTPSPPPPSIPPPGTKWRTSTLTTKNNQKKKLKLLHWLKLSRADPGSLWAEAQKSGEDSKTPKIDNSELEFHFSHEVSDQGRRASVGHKPQKVQLIEFRRAYNCEIMLSKVKIPLHDLMSSVLALDENALDVDQVNNLIKFCPRKDEMDVLKGYEGDRDKLGKCEQFFLHLMQVPQIESKLIVFSFKIQFCTQVSDLSNNLNIVNSAADQIRGSSKLKRIMLTILALGNTLNQGTAKGSAVGFRLDSLLKLTETRARTSQMTLMHYLCKMLAEKLPELLDFWQDLSSLEPASKIQRKYLAEEKLAIKEGLKKAVQELSSSENDGHVSDHFRKALKEFLSFAKSEERSLDSLNSGVDINVDALILYFGEDKSRYSFEQVITTLLNFVESFKKAHEENSKQLEFERKKEALMNASDTAFLLKSSVKSVK